LLALILLTAPPFPDARVPLGGLAFSGIIGIAVSDTLVLAGLSRVGTTMTAASFCLAAPLAALLAAVFLGESLSLVECSGIALALGATGGVIALQNADETPRESREWRAGLLFLLLGQIANAMGIVVGHHALADVGILYGTSLRILPAIAVLVPVQIYLLRNRRGPRPVISLACVIGTLLGLTLMSLGLKYARAGIAAALNSTYPIWSIPIARVFLKEKVSLAAVILMGVAVVGIGILFLY
jgi:drug/metabolite transporter (DMT)-like permease